MRTLLLSLTVFLTACATGPSVNIAEVPASYRSSINSKITSDSYPSFMAAEGNIYSCRYGIALVKSDSFQPPKEHIFASYLKKYRPDINTSQITLRQLDVYHNNRLEMLAGAGAAVGGIIGGSIAHSALKSQKGFSNSKLKVYDLNKGSYAVPGENAVGCDDKHEGEYYTSRVTGGSSVIVSWFNLEYAGKFYRYRTTYEYQSEGADPRAEKAAAIEKAFESSVRSIDDQIR